MTPSEIQASLLATLLAEYHTHRQLVLDLNQPAALREYHRDRAWNAFLGLKVAETVWERAHASGVLAVRRT